MIVWPLRLHGSWSLPVTVTSSPWAFPTHTYHTHTIPSAWVSTLSLVHKTRYSPVVCISTQTLPSESCLPKLKPSFSSLLPICQSPTFALIYLPSEIIWIYSLMSFTLVECKLKKKKSSYRYFHHIKVALNKYLTCHIQMRAYVMNVQIQFYLAFWVWETPTVTHRIVCCRLYSFLFCQ